MQKESIKDSIVRENPIVENANIASEKTKETNSAVKVLSEFTFDPKEYSTPIKPCEKVNRIVEKTGQF